MGTTVLIRDRGIDRGMGWWSSTVRARDWQPRPEQDQAHRQALAQRRKNERCAPRI